RTRSAAPLPRPCGPSARAPALPRWPRGRCAYRLQSWVWPSEKLSRTAHSQFPQTSRRCRAMSELGFHRIEDDIADSWLDDWVGAGVAEIEAFLGKHADFLRYLAMREAAQPAAE